MPSALLSLEEARTLLGLDDTEDDPALQRIIDGLADHLGALVGRRFSTGTSAIADEAHNGNDKDWLWLDYPASALTTVKLGNTLASPDETLDGTDPETLVIDPRLPRRIRRVDGGVFPKGARNVYVSYTPTGATPGGARMALQEAVAFAWRRRGSEDALSEGWGGVNHSLANDLMAHVPAWRSYIQSAAPRIG